MGTKLNPGAFDCYANALPDEPFFVLLARDPLAPDIVAKWAMGYMERKEAEKFHNGTIPNASVYDKFLEAARCAIAMKAWREANPKPEGGYPKPPAAIYVSEQQGRKIYDKLRYDLGITQFTGHSITLIRQAVNEVLNEGADKSSAPADAATVKDYEDAIRVRKIVDDAITAYVDGMLGRGNGEYLVAQFVGTVSKALGREPIHEYDERRKRGE